MLKQRTISVIGLGYVGLPVAVAFGREFKTIGFDINQQRIEQLKSGYDVTAEVSAEELKLENINFTSDINEVSQADFHIVAVPTPVNSAKQPDLSMLVSAAKLIGSVLKKGDIVVFESTVYPGVTEDELLPVLERESGLKGGEGFKVGYSPERINPGDKEHRFTNIKKVVSGQDQESLEIIADTYASVVEAGVFKAGSIKVAEAAKVIENTQRDLNIALMNELAIIFDMMEIPTTEVLEAAKTKWNFLPFSPGLVGGHCIGVDPYYLTYKAEQLGYIPQVIMAGRRINDDMGKFVARQVIREMILAGHQVLGSTVTVLGLTFKENCPDLRNSRVMSIIEELADFGVKIQLHDPLANPEEAEKKYSLSLKEYQDLKPAEAVIAAVAHDEYKEDSLDKLSELTTDNAVIADIKGIYNHNELSDQGYRVWSL